MNATKHGLAGQSADVGAEAAGEFESRRAKWAEDFTAEGEGAGWALDRAVAASIRIEQCEQGLNALATAERERARLAWDQDRAIEAAEILARLARDPILASRQLEATRAGVTLLVESWLGLIQAFEAGEDWSEAEASMALDLLGVSPHFRSRTTPITPPEGIDALEFHKAVALDELDRLEAARDRVLTPLDEMERRHAVAGDVALLSKQAKLILRYERDAWRRYRESMKVLQAQAPATPPVDPAPPKLPGRPVTPVPGRAVRRDAPTPSPRLRAEMTALRTAMGFDDDDAWLDEVERRLGGAPGPLVTERTQFADFPIGRPS